MAINSNTPRQEFLASEGQTAFNFNFKIFQDSDIVAYLTPSGQTADDTTDLLALITDYTLVIDGDNGGTLTLTSATSLNDSVVILRILPFTRTVDYQTGGDLLEATLDEDQNYQTYLTQQLDARENRYILMPESLTGVSAILPSPVPDAYIKWNVAGTALENDTTIPDAVATAEAAAQVASDAALEAEAAKDAVLAVSNDVVNGIKQTFYYISTASQDTFSATYNVGYVDVFVEGIKLIDSVDFTATDGTSVVLTTPLVAGLDVEIVGWGVYIGTTQILEWS